MPNYSPPAGSKTFTINKNTYYTYSQNGTTTIVANGGAVLATVPNGSTNYTFTQFGDADAGLKSQLSNPTSPTSKTVKSISGTQPPNVATEPPTSSSGAATNIEPSTEISIGNRINKYPKKLLAYPLNRQGNGGDYINFEIRTYQKSGLASPTAAGGSEYQGSDVTLLGMEKRKSTLLANIYLPIQSGIVDSMSVDWGSGELNPITAAFANLAYGTIDNAGTGDMGRVFQGVVKDMAAIGKSFNNASGELRKLLVNYFTQEAVGTQGLLSRTVGGALNNNLELLFNGPMLRSFTFNFKLTPREPKEAELIKDIIRYFKKSMVPGLSTSKLFLLAPNIFKLKYVYTGKGDKAEDHPYLNRIKVAALRDFSVNYSPDGNYMTYADGGSMTQYDLSMTFAEIDPIYEPDYEEGEGLVGMGW